MRRRSAVVGVSAAAALAGTGVALWRSRRAPTPLDVWSLRFPQPGGGELALAQARGQRLLLNFWATWCPPCVTEMPLLDRFSRDQAGSGWRVVGLAVDQFEPVRRFLLQRPVHFAVGLTGLEGIDLSRRLGNSKAALPFTVVFETDGSVLHRKLGALEPDELASWSRSVG